MSEIYIPARVETPQLEQENLDEVLKRINEHTLEDYQSLDQVFVFSGVISNDRLDSYLTKMDIETTLNNYVRNLIEGVSLMPGHDVSKDPYGRSFDGSILDPQYAGGSTAVRGDFYIERGINVNGTNTNDQIRRIKSGIQRDLSVGFGGDQLWYRCSSCGRNLLTDWDCSHFPGLEDEDGRQTYAVIMEAQLREVSTVYKGATPGAYIDKARSYIEQGQLPEKSIIRLENAYNTRFDHGGSKRSFYVPQNGQQKQTNEKKEGIRTMNELLNELREAIRENKLEKGRVYDILTEEGEPFRQPDDIAMRNELGRDNTKVDSIRQLKKEAQQGRRYLADMIDDAVKSRIRNQGNTFNVDTYKRMLRDSADIDVIKEEIDSYERLAKEKLQGGRQTEQEQVPNKQEEENPEDNKQRFDYEKDNFFDGGDQ